MKSHYRIALLADIHGNYPAFEAVLQDLTQWHPDRIVLLGDLAMNCIYPVQVLEQIQTSQLESVVGNTDQEVLSAVDPVARWVYNQLPASHVAFLQSLPSAIRLTPPNARSPQSDLLLVHSTPRSCFDVLILSPHPLGTTFTQTTPTAEIAPMLQNEVFHTMVYGHIHYVSSAQWQGQQLISIGSVGFPFDGDQRAAYALADWDGTNWRFTHHRVAYDYEQVAREVEFSSLPFAARYAAMLRAANWLPRSAYE